MAHTGYKFANILICKLALYIFISLSIYVCMYIFLAYIVISMTVPQVLTDNKLNLCA